MIKIDAGPRAVLFKEFVRGTLGGGNSPHSETLEPSDWDFILEQLRMHCLQPLVFHHFSKTDIWAAWPEFVRKRIEETARYEMARAAVVGDELSRLFQAFQEKGIESILLKGSALAYSVYPEPYLRPRLDTDLLIRKSDIQKVQEAVRLLGYEFNSMIEGELISHQMMAVKHDFLGMAHMLDIHWQVFNEPAFMNTLRFDEILKDSVRVQFPEAEVKAIGAGHALLHACLHRVVHHHNAENLHWLYDMHLLASVMNENSAKAFLNMAEQKKVKKICAQSILAAREFFQTRLCAPLNDFVNAPHDEKEFSVEYLKSSAAPEVLRDFMLNCKALGSWEERGKLLKEHLFPSVKYLRGRYPSANGVWPPLLYAWRWVDGARKLSAQIFRNLLCRLKTLKNK